MPRFSPASVTALALVAMLLALGCAKRLATPVPPPSTAGAMTTPSPGGPGTGTLSEGAASDRGAAGTPAPPSTAAPATPGAPLAGSPGTRPNIREFVAVPDLKDIHFDFDRYDIRPDAARTLDANARWLKANPGALVLIEGHADEQGTNDYNLALGERRAKAAMNYLVGQGLPADRLTIISYGEEWPSCRERNEACWAQNRRAHFLTKPQ
jgi:peptidoglycan-associated lipoprotein